MLDPDPIPLWQILHVERHLIEFFFELSQFGFGCFFFLLLLVVLIPIVVFRGGIVVGKGKISFPPGGSLSGGLLRLSFGDQRAVIVVVVGIVDCGGRPSMQPSLSLMTRRSVVFPLRFLRGRR